MSLTPKHIVAGERGVTLLETTVVVGLITLILAAALASLGRYMAQRTLGGWGESVVNDIRAAQQLGIARRAPAVITFTAQSGGVPASYTVTVGGATARNQTLPGELNVTSSTVQFNTLGAPAAGVTLTLTDSRDGTTVSIAVAPVTGAVTAQ